MKFIKCFVPLLSFFALILSSAHVLGAVQNSQVIQLSDNLDAKFPYARVYVYNRDSGEKVTVDLSQSLIKTVTVTQQGNLINVLLGQGNNSNAQDAIVWTQPEISSSSAPLVIDFTKTPVAALIKNYVGTQTMIDTAGDVPQIGVAQIGANLQGIQTGTPPPAPVILFFPTPATTVWPGSSGPSETNSIFTTCFTFPVAK